MSTRECKFCRTILVEHDMTLVSLLRASAWDKYLNFRVFEYLDKEGKVIWSKSEECNVLWFMYLMF